MSDYAEQSDVREMIEAVSTHLPKEEAINLLKKLLKTANPESVGKDLQRAITCIENNHPVRWGV